MSERIHGLAQHLLPEKSSLNEYSLEELQHIGKRYPYFAPVQFLLLEKLKETGSPEQAVQQRRTALYFHDVLLYENFIQPERFLQDALFVQAVTEKKAAGKTNDSAAIEMPVFAEEEKARVAENAKLAPSEKWTQEETVRSTVLEPLPAVSQPASKEENFVAPDKVSQNEVIPEPEPGLLPGKPLQEITLSLPEKPVPEKEKTAEESLAIHPLRSAALSDEKPVTVREVAVPEPFQAPSAREEQMQGEAGVVQPGAATAGEPLAFEPFHTVDYFASQGIRVTADDLPKDKLTKQLRSFTDWLKVMKRLPATEIQGSLESPAEKTVENMASHSVEGSDVLTEAMAEVWAKQGNRQKAIETYNKLSLLNPSKKAYFAAKIENLSRT